MVRWHIKPFKFISFQGSIGCFLGREKYTNKFKINNNFNNNIVNFPTAIIEIKADKILTYTILRLV